MEDVPQEPNKVVPDAENKAKFAIVIIDLLSKVTFILLLPVMEFSEVLSAILGHSSTV